MFNFLLVATISLVIVAGFLFYKGWSPKYAGQIIWLGYGCICVLGSVGTGIWAYFVR